MFTIIRWVIAQKSRLPLPFVRIGIGIYNRFKKKKSCPSNSFFTTCLKGTLHGLQHAKGHVCEWHATEGPEIFKKCSNSQQVLQVT